MLGRECNIIGFSVFVLFKSNIKILNFYVSLSLFCSEEVLAEIFECMHTM